jgi:hypothetical protein
VNPGQILEDKNEAGTVRVAVNVLRLPQTTLRQLVLEGEYGINERTLILGSGILTSLDTLLKGESLLLTIIVGFGAWFIYGFALRLASSVFVAIGGILGGYANGDDIRVGLLWSLLPLMLYDLILRPLLNIVQISVPTISVFSHNLEWLRIPFMLWAAGLGVFVCKEAHRFGLTRATVSYFLGIAFSAVIVVIGFFIFRAILVALALTSLGGIR